jgi:hypothetical protein
LETMARILVATGIFLLIMGGIMWLFSRVGGGFHLPGDIHYQRGNFTLYFPIATCIIISIILTMVLNLWRR